LQMHCSFSGHQSCWWKFCNRDTCRPPFLWGVSWATWREERHELPSTESCIAPRRIMANEWRQLSLCILEERHDWWFRRRQGLRTLFSRSKPPLTHGVLEYRETSTWNTRKSKQRTVVYQQRYAL
jgi:hypothetical protein